MSAQNEQEHSFQVRTLRETDASIIVEVGRGNETVVFTYTPPYKIEVDFPGKEVAVPPEHPAITIEGNPAFKHKLEKGRYSLRLAYHPDPKNKADARFYNVVAKGDSAKEFYSLYITDTRMQLHVTGTLVAGEKGTTAGTIMAESIEIIHGRKAGSDILSEKVRLADKQ
jgi:hypothetical protein